MGNGPIPDPLVLVSRDQPCYHLQMQCNEIKISIMEDTKLYWYCLFQFVPFFFGYIYILNVYHLLEMQPYTLIRDNITNIKTTQVLFLGLYFSVEAMLHESCSK